MCVLGKTPFKTPSPRAYALPEMPRKAKRRRSSEPWYEFNAKADESTAAIRIFGPIGGDFFFDEDAVTGKAIAQQLDELSDDIRTIRVFVSSPGGNAFDGIHIANALRRQSEEHGRAVEVEIEALAASAATIITSAGTTIRMPSNALMMVHMPTGFADGPPSTMKKVAQALERMTSAIVATYRWVSKLSAKQLRALMEETTWMDAEEALANGFITEISEAGTAKAMFSGTALAHLDVPSDHRALANSIFGCGATDVDAGAEFADLCNNAIDEMVEDDEDVTRAEVIEQLSEASGRSVSTVNQILRGEIECSPDDVVDGFVEVLSITADQADTALSSSARATSTRASAKGSKGTMAIKRKNRNGNGNDTDAAMKAEERKRERLRIRGIETALRIALTGGLSEKDWKLKATEATDEDVPLDDFRNEVLDALAEKSDAAGGPGPNAPHTGTEVQVIEDERDKRVRGISAALWHRAAGVGDTIRKAMEKKPEDPAFQNLELDPGEFRGMSLVDHARESLEREQSGSTRGLTKMQIAGDFFALAGQTTSDFAVALEEALHKVLQASYAISPDTWRRFCAVGTVSDFRAHNRYRMGFLSRLDEVREDGEFKNKTIADATKEVQQAKTWGNILTLSRKALINDDMGIFDNVATSMGRAAALSIELEVYDMLKRNAGLGPTMNDGKSLFHADHNNLGGGAALTATAIDADSVVMAKQTDQSTNEVLALEPAVLVLERGLKSKALEINKAEFTDFARGKPNVVMGLFGDIVATPHLTGTRRYLFADPAAAPVIEVAFLEGQQEPFMETKDGWRIDGVEWKVRHDFGVAGIDFRGAVTDAGV